ncbi:hypothetical protein V8E54_006451 [Elaphomyces granulatus]
MTSTPVGLFALSTACVSQKPNDWLWDALVLRKRLESFFNPLSLLYKSQSKLDEAERMYQRALQGRPFRHSTWGVWTRLKSCTQEHVGPSSDECQRLERSIASLDPTQAGTGDSGGTLVRVEAANVALHDSAKKKSRSVGS